MPLVTPVSTIFLLEMFSTLTYDYEEYSYDLDEISHDPYVLISMLCSIHDGPWTLDDVTRIKSTSIRCLNAIEMPVCFVL